MLIIVASDKDPVEPATMSDAEADRQILTVDGQFVSLRKSGFSANSGYLLVKPEDWFFGNGVALKAPSAKITKFGNRTCRLLAVGKTTKLDLTGLRQPPPGGIHIMPVLCTVFRFAQIFQGHRQWQFMREYA